MVIGVNLILYKHAKQIQQQSRITMKQNKLDMTSPRIRENIHVDDLSG
jgi:hypothetical protein